MAFTDKTITCRDCGNGFVFTSGEQEFYASKGFVSEPTRCPGCRQTRKTRGHSGKAKSWLSSGRGQSSDAVRRERVVHTVVCENCGCETTVPFVPRGHRPVYCSDCFELLRTGNRQGNS